MIRYQNKLTKPLLHEKHDYCFRETFKMSKTNQDRALSPGQKYGNLVWILLLAVHWNDRRNERNNTSNTRTRCGVLQTECSFSAFSVFSNRLRNHGLSIPAISPEDKYAWFPFYVPLTHLASFSKTLKRLARAKCCVGWPGFVDLGLDTQLTFNITSKD